MIDTFFSYGMVTDEDVKFYKAVPGTMKITGIKATDNGVVNIPETIDGLPVMLFQNAETWRSFRCLKRSRHSAVRLTDAHH